MNGAAPHFQIDAVDRDESGEFLGQVLGLEDDVGTHVDATSLNGIASSLPVSGGSV
jgi:hypothetical protein